MTVQTERALYDEMLDMLRIESVERRIAHPDWPSHRQTTRFPSGALRTLETMPLGKIERVRGYCKYCYQTHNNWWLMDQRDYSNDDGFTIVLCGECGYTIVSESCEFSERSLARIKAMAARHISDGAA